jgi:CheY-like chemotaxis protein
MARDDPKGCAAVVSRPLHVLVVDDNPLAREVVIAYLTTDGHTAETATNGREGLTKFKAGHFDLVVTDGKMPEMGGYRLADGIKQVAPNMPVMMFTGTLPNEKPETVDAVVGKPVAFTTFRETVARVMSAVIRPPPIIDELD